MVELQQRTLQHSSERNSSSSAIDLTGTPTGLGASSRPPSPTTTLSPINNGTGANRARRRASWGRVDAAQDPLRFDLHATAHVHAQTMDYRQANNPERRPPPPALTLDDPFFSLVDAPSPPSSPTPPPRNNYPFSGPDVQYGAGGGQYTTAQPGPSSASLMSRESEAEGGREDDEARLTRSE